MLARLGYPLSRLLQKRFAEGSKLAMRQSVRDRWLIEVIGHAGDNRHHLCLWQILLAPFLLICFCKRWVATFNLAATKRITGRFVARLPGFGILRT